MAMQKFQYQKSRLPVILFRVSDEEFAINLADAKEIIQAGQIRKLPESQEYIEGIYNYRGNIIHIIDLKKKLRIVDRWHYKDGDPSIQAKKESGTKYFIIATIGGKDTGFIVDELSNIAYIPPENVAGLDPIIQTNVEIQYIKGILKIKDKPRILLDLGKIIAETEQKTTKDQELSNSA